MYYGIYFKMWYCDGSVSIDCPTDTARQLVAVYGMILAVV